MKLRKFEVVSKFGNVLGYIRARDIDHAYTQAAQRYRVPFAIIGAGA